jgi:predicted acylesterase/phospholipase RssA
LKERNRKKLEFSKTGLVCSGGATKAAAFHIGVCLALRDKDFSFIGGLSERITPPDCNPYPRPKHHPKQIATYVGSSAGALIVSMLAAGVGIESVINSFADSTKFKMPGTFRTIPRIQYRDMLAFNWPSKSGISNFFKRKPIMGKTLESMVLGNLKTPGIFTTRGLAQYLKNYILPTEHFNELKSDLFVVGTQLDHSRKMVFGRFGTEKTFDEYCQYASNAQISDAVAASMSLPLIFSPYKVKHGENKSRYYIDGEIRETLSTHVASENGCDLIICSYTHQPYHYKQEIGSLNQYGLPSIIIQSLYQAIEQKVYGARKAHENKKAAVDTVKQFFKEKKYPDQDLEELVHRLQDKIDFNDKLNYIFIHPEPKDREMFFGEHFTLNPEVLQNVVSIGYKRAMAELRRYDLIPMIA